MLPVLQASGLTAAVAVWMVSLKGVGASGRSHLGSDASAGWHPIDVGRVSIAIMPLSFLVFLAGGNGSAALPFAWRFGTDL
jgi:hypothetical protein